MCRITFCTIFSCGHLESIFNVDACSRATSRNLRYCNRFCSPLILDENSSPSLCAVCIADTNTATSETEPGAAQGRGPWDQPYLDLFRMMRQPLMRLKVPDHRPFSSPDRESCIYQYVAPESWLPIFDAVQLTKGLQDQLLGRWFPPDGSAGSGKEEFLAYVNSKGAVLDMEVLALEMCSGDCFCDFMTGIEERGGLWASLPFSPFSSFSSSEDDSDEGREMGEIEGDGEGDC